MATRDDAPRDATAITSAANQAVLDALPFDDVADFEDARRGFLGILEDKKSADRPSVRAAAWAGLGEAYYLRPSPDKREALFACLRVPYLYADEKDEMPKALYYAAHSYSALADAETDVEKQKVAKSRVGELWKRLKNEYAGTPWAEKSPPKR